MIERWLDDYVPGAVHELGTFSVSEAEMVDFARQFDPQPIHVDPDFAARGPFGGIIASGWHTGSLMMRRYALHYLSPASSLSSPGVDELRWLRPVRPGDTLTARREILAVTRSQSRPDRGTVKTKTWVRNQDGDLVMTFENLMQLPKDASARL